jgi:RNA polymerase sigma factor FliA
MAGGAARSSPIVLAEAWRQYKRTGDRSSRNQLILAYSPMVKYLAGGVAARMPPHVEVADLVSYGIGGLIEAVERFDPGRGVKFEAYASTRIRGAIFDELRSLDWVPRRIRREARRIERATVELSSSLHRTPTDAELAAQLSIDTDELDASLQRVADTHMVALDHPWDVGEADGPETTLLETLPDPDAPDPAVSAVSADLRQRITDAILHLPERERLVLALRYHQDMRLAEIGEILGVTESRASQLHAMAVLHVRALLPDELEAAQR